MKIAMFVNNLAVSGGYQKLVIRLAQQLSELGHVVDVYTPELDRQNCYPKDINSIDVKTLKVEEMNGTLVDRYEKLVAKVKGKYDSWIIHDELSLIAIALLPKRKSIWMLNNQYPENLGKYLPEMKSSFTQKSATMKNRINDTREARRRTGLMKQGLKKIDYFATYDSFNKRLVRKYLKRNADIVYAGADLDSFKKLAPGRKFEQKKTYKILSVGVLFPHRRYEDLIKAVAILKKQKLPLEVVIVGRQDLSPAYYDRLKKMVKDNNLSKVVSFKNYVTDKEMTRLYKQSDVFVFINDGFTWGISAFEAVAAKLPLIITNNIGAVDLIENGKYGYTVEPRSPGQVAKAISILINNRSKAKEIAETAYKDVADFVSWRAYTKRMLELIKE